MPSCRMLSLLLVVSVLLCETASSHAQHTTAIVFSGGGSRIAQQMAMMSTLFTGNNSGAVKLVPDFLSGASAGSICAVLTNALYRTAEDPTAPIYTPSNFTRLLKTMSDISVIDLSISGIERIITQNLYQNFILDNTPLRELITRELDLLGFRTLKDLYIPTCIAVTDSEDGSSYGLCSTNPEVNELPLVDVIMASSAIPVFFKPEKLNLPKKYGSGTYIDGSFGRSFVPISVALDRKVDRIYTILHNQDKYSFNPTPLKEYGILGAIINMIELFSSVISFTINASYESAIQSWKCINRRVYVFQPELSRTYPLLDFSNMLVQYDEALEWAQRNQPVCLNCDK